MEETKMYYTIHREKNKLPKSNIKKNTSKRTYTRKNETTRVYNSRATRYY